MSMMESQFRQDTKRRVHGGNGNILFTNVYPVLRAPSARRSESITLI